MIKLSFKELEVKLLAPLKGQYSALYLSFNESAAANKMTVKEYYEHIDETDFYPVSEEDNKICVSANSLWVLQWFPNSPVGSHSVGASSLSILLSYVFEQDVDALYIETLLKSKMTGEYPTVEIRYNDHSCSYRSTKDTIENSKISDMCKYEFTWVTPEEEQLAIDKNALWAYNQFPRGPGDIRLNASSLEVILDHL
jgi:hypothetical protein